MRIPLLWLKEYVDINLPPDVLSSALTMAGLEVSAIEFHGEKIDGVVVGKIKSIEKHIKKPDLLICQVDIGRKIVQIITDAKNIQLGDRVPVALPGATLVKDIKVKRMELHGVETFGMMCKAHELGLTQAEGILILPSSSTPGEDVRKVLGLGGYVFEIDVLPNRSDCLSILGIAREVGALVGKPIKYPKIKVIESKKKIQAKVEVREPSLCKRYMARVIEGVKVGESPSYLKNHLIAAGIRPINSVVDITNYVLLEMGQPLHAFDLKKLFDQTIIVRRAKKGEKIITLDGVEHGLFENTLVICDTASPVAIAGVMGGAKTEVDLNTTSILLEGAYFNPQSINRTSKALKIRTESSIRFEHGVDFERIPKALDRAASLIKELAHGEILKGAIDIKEREQKPKIISLREERVNKILGVDLLLKEMINILQRLEFKVLKKEKGKALILSPSFRLGDIEREIDLIEEIARIHGYNKIRETMPKIVPQERLIDKKEILKRKVRDIMVSAGLNEVSTFSMVSPKIKDMPNIPQNDPFIYGLKISNPLSLDESVMRTMLLPSLLNVLSYNLNRQIEDVAIFEMGKIFLPVKAKLPKEVETLALVLMGNIGGIDCDFYYLKGIVENLLNELGIKKFKLKRGTHYMLHPGKAAILNEIGFFGELHPEAQKAFGLPRAPYVLEFNLDLLTELYTLAKRFAPLPKYPKVTRDIAMFVPPPVTHQNIVDIIKEVGGSLIEEVSLFDRYKNSLAYRITYRDPSRTLTDEEVNQRHEEIAKVLSSKLKVEVRR